MNSISIASYITQLENENKELREVLDLFYNNYVKDEEDDEDDEDDEDYNENEDSEDEDSEDSENEDSEDEDSEDEDSEDEDSENEDSENEDSENEDSENEDSEDEDSEDEDEEEEDNEDEESLKEFMDRIEKETIIPVSTNEEIAWHLDILGNLERCEHRRIAYKNAAVAIRKLDFEVTNGYELSTGDNKVPGIGKGIAAKIDEFIQTGEIKRIDELTN